MRAERHLSLRKCGLRSDTTKSWAGKKRDEPSGSGDSCPRSNRCRPHPLHTDGHRDAASKWQDPRKRDPTRGNQLRVHPRTRRIEAPRECDEHGPRGASALSSGPDQWAVIPMRAPGGKPSTAAPRPPTSDQLNCHQSNPPVDRNGPIRCVCHSSCPWATTHEPTYTSPSGSKRSVCVEFALGIV
eukprot:5413921-Prymnesium_polylepis.3